MNLTQFFKVEDGELVEYRRLGSCNQCGKCCCKHTITYKMTTQLAGRSGGEMSEEDYDDWSDWEDWSVFYAQGVWWYFLVTDMTDKPNVCGCLTDEGRCSIWQDPLKFKPVCRYWPWHPSETENFPECGFSFEKVEELP